MDPTPETEWLRTYVQEWSELPLALAAVAFVALIATGVRRFWMAAFQAGRKSRDEFVAHLLKELEQRQRRE